MTFQIDPWIAAAIGLGSAVLILIIAWGVRRLTEPVVYIEAVDSLLTPAEQKFYKALDRGIDGRFAILAKVRVADILNLTSDSGRTRHRIFMSIAYKHIDFVLAEQEDLHPVAAIELDDSSHQRTDRQKRDELLDTLFKRAEFPLIRFPTAAAYDSNAIDRTVREFVNY
jgi:hypothetical protein